MKNLDDETINKFKEAGYSFEEITDIDKGIQELNEGKGIPLGKVMYDFYSSKKEKTCIK